MNVTLHPSAVLAESLREADDCSIDDLIRLFIQAVDLGAARKPILEKYLLKKNALHVFDPEHAAFFEWSWQNSFRTKSARPRRPQQLPDDSPATPAVHSPRDPALERFMERAEEIASKAGIESAAIVSIIEKKASDHRYGLFPPGWEVDTVEWCNAFGPDDPCMVVSDYIRGLFCGPSRYDRAEKESHVLDGIDRKLLDIILFELAKKISSDGRYFPDYAIATIRSILKAACGAWIWDEDIDDFTLKLDFLDHLAKAPNSIGKALLNRWAKTDHEWALRDGKMDDDRLYEQNAFVAAVLVKYLLSRGVKENSKFPLNELLDENAIDAVPTISDMSVKELVDLKYELWSSSTQIWCGSDRCAAEALYNARDLVFGGIFPFPLSDAAFYIGALGGDTDYWLACISLYPHGELGDYAFGSDPYAVFSSHDPRPNDLGSDLHRSTRRFNAFCSAYTEMAAARLDELSIAWWAFFIASQSLAFPNMRLSPVQLGRLADITRARIPNKLIGKALRFALKNSDQSTSVLGRVLNHTIRSLLAACEEDNVVELRPSRPTKEETRSFLENRIGTETWAALCDESRNDLLDAERLWSIAARDYGAGRRDWGGIVTLYARVVESEMRLHLAALFDSLETEGIAMRERTLGGCLSTLRSANDALRKGGLRSIPEGMALRIKSVHRSFSDNFTFMKDQRDHAAHGNREAHIKPDDFYRWRRAILDEKALSVIVDA